MSMTAIEILTEAGFKPCVKKNEMILKLNNDTFVLYYKDINKLQLIMYNKHSGHMVSTLLHKGQLKQLLNSYFPIDSIKKDISYA